jgi:hypothetical protein
MVDGRLLIVVVVVVVVWVFCLCFYVKCEERTSISKIFKTYQARTPTAVASTCDTSGYRQPVAPL